MTFWDHLEALRWVILRSVIALFVAMIAVFPFVPWIFDNIILAPADSDFILYRFFDKLSAIYTILPGGSDKPVSINIINYQLSSQFFTHMTISMWLAFMITAPYVIFEIWKFVCPALYSNERKKLRPLFLFGSLMFYIGWTVGYFVIFPLTLRFLYTYQLSATIVNQLSLQSYMDNFMLLTFTMGLMFELPILSIVAGRLGIISRDLFRQYRRHAIVAILVIAAIITPTTDPFTLFAVFFPIYILWEISAFIVPDYKQESNG